VLYHLLYSLHTNVSGFNVFRYITLRALLGGITALLLSLTLGPFLIRALNRKHALQAIRDDGPKSHIKKQGTPTMGGLLILVSVIISTLLWSDLTNSYVWVVLGVMVVFGMIGGIDDLKKVKESNSAGLSERNKLILQSLATFIILAILYEAIGLSTRLYVPFIRVFSPDMGIFYFILGWFVLVGTSNSVNLTDGLDGLAIGPVISTCFTFAIFSYVSGNIKLAEYLYIPFIKNAGELAIFCSSIVCAGMGFLWFNTYPAQVFMGDLGSLGLGAAIGTIALITKTELLLVVVGGIFVIEAASVLTQRISYKLTKKRIFKMAPIHHHFELCGWPEPQITVRFWIISIVLAMIGLATLKIR